MRHRKHRLIIDIAPAQRAGIQPVFICAGRRTNHCPIQLGVVADVNVVTPLTRKQPGLLLHTVITAVHFILTGAQVTAAGHTAKGKATACRHTGLPGIIAVVILLTGQQQIAPHIGHDALTTDLCADETGVSTTGQADSLPRIHRGFRPAVATAHLAAFGRVDVGKDAESCPTVTQPKTDTNVPAAAAVAAGQRLGIACRQQINRVSRIQVYVVGSL